MLVVEPRSCLSISNAIKIRLVFSLTKGLDINNQPLQSGTDPHLWDIRWVRDLAYLAVVMVLLLALYKTRSVMAPVLIGMVLAYVVDPLAKWGHRCCKLPRWLTAGIITVTILLVFGGVLLWAVPRVNTQIKDLADMVPTYIEATSKRIGLEVDSRQFREQISGLTLDPIAPTAASTIREYAGPISAAVRYMYVFAFGLIGSAASVITYVPLATVITCFCFFFFTWHWPAIIGWFDQFIPHSSRTKTLNILKQMDKTIAGFIRGRLIQAAVMGAVLSVGWSFWDVPYWLLLGLGCGLLNLVPFLAVIGWILAVGLAGADELASIAMQNAQHLAEAQSRGLEISTITLETFRWTALVWPTVVYLLAQLLDGWVVEPIVQGRVTNLDPLTVLLSVLVGGALAGLLGMVLAIPIAACIKILSQEVLVPRLREYAAAR